MSSRATRAPRRGSRWSSWRSRDDERFEVSRVELDREGPSYTADTLRELREQSPDDELFLILGGDQAAALAAWHEPEQVLALATVAVVERPMWSRNAIGIKIGRLPGADADPLPRHADHPDLLERDPPARGRRAADPLPGAGPVARLHRGERPLRRPPAVAGEAPA